MTTNLNFTIPVKAKKSKALIDSINTVEDYIERIERHYTKMEKIYKLNISEEIKNEAHDYLVKQDVLLKIAQDLRNKFQAFRPVRILHAVKKRRGYNFNQLAIELGLLKEMHYRMSKAYVSFLFKYHNKIISVKKKDV